MTSSTALQTHRDAIIGIDPLLNAYFMALVENGQDVGNPLLFSFQGEDDSPSAQAQVRRIEHLKLLWLEQQHSVEQLEQVYGKSVPESALYD